MAFGTMQAFGGGGIPSGMGQTVFGNQFPLRRGYQPVGYGGGGFAQTPAGQAGPEINQGGNIPPSGWDIYQPSAGGYSAGSVPGYAAGPGAPAGGNLLGGYQPVGPGGYSAGAGAGDLVRRRVSQGTTHRVRRYAGGGLTGGSDLNALNPMGYLPSGMAPSDPTTGGPMPGTTSGEAPGTTPATKTPLQPGMRIGQMTRGLWQQLGQRIGYQPRGY